MDQLISSAEEDLGPGIQPEELGDTAIIDVDESATLKEALIALRNQILTGNPAPRSRLYLIIRKFAERALKDETELKLFSKDIEFFCRQIRGYRPICGDSLLHIILDQLESSMSRKPVCIDICKVWIRMILEIGRSFMLNSSFSRVFCLIKFSPKPENSGCKHDEVSVLILEALKSIIALTGPESYFRFAETPITIKLDTSPFANPNGYTITCFFRIGRNNQARHNFTSILSENGNGIEITLRNNILEARSIPSADRHKFVSLSSPLSVNRWYFISIVHFTYPRGQVVSNLRNSPVAGRILLYIDGQVQQPVPVLYPPTNNIEKALILTLGGFNGDVGSYHVFGVPLSGEQILSIFSSAPSFSPSFILQKSTDLSLFMPSRRNISGFIPATVIRLSAKNVSNGYILPDSWSRNFGNSMLDSFDPVLLKSCRAIVRPNHKKILFSKGGLKYLLYTFSLQTPLHGRSFYSEAEVKSILELVSEFVVENPAALLQMSDLGVICLRQYILAHVPFRMRSLTLLNGILQFLHTIEKEIQFPNHAAEIFTDSFRLLFFDLTYWLPDSRDTTILQESLDVIKNVCSIAVSLVSIHHPMKYFKQEITVTYLLNQLWFLCSPYLDSVEAKNASPAKSPSPLRSIKKRNKSSVYDLSFQAVFDKYIPKIAADVLLCASELTSQNCIPQHIEEISFLIDYCRKPELALEFFLHLLKLMSFSMKSFSEVFCKNTTTNLFNSKQKMCAPRRFLIDHLQSSLEEVRICCLKILGAFVNVLPSRKRDVFVTEIAASIDIATIGLYLTPRLYESLTELTYGIVELSLFGYASIDADMPIQFPIFLKIILRLAQDDRCEISLKERVLLDLLTWLKSNEKNIECVSREGFWQSSVFRFLTSAQCDGHSAVKQLLIEVIETFFWNFIFNKPMGWADVYQTIWFLDNSLSSSAIDTYSVQTSIALRLFNKIIRAYLDSSSNLLPTAISQFQSESGFRYTNLRLTILLLEYLLFSSPRSPLVISRSLTENERVLFSRFLAVVVSFVAFDERPLYLFRIFFRFLEIMLIHPDFRESFDSHVFFIRKVFLENSFVGSSDSKSILSLGMTYLNNASESLLRQNFDDCSKKITSILIDVYKKWSPLMYEPENTDFPEFDDFKDNASTNESSNYKSIHAQNGEECSILPIRPDCDRNLGPSDETAEEEILLRIYQNSKANHDTWFSASISQFNTAFNMRQKKISQQMLVLQDQLDSNSKDSESRAIELYFDPKSRDSERWSDALSRLQILSASFRRKDSEQLYSIGKKMKHFSRDLDSRPLPFESMSLMGSCESEAGFCKSYWKIDRTETSNRSHPIFRRNFKGHDHRISCYEETRYNSPRKLSDEFKQFQDIVNSSSLMQSESDDNMESCQEFSTKDVSACDDDSSIDEKVAGDSEADEPIDSLGSSDILRSPDAFIDDSLINGLSSEKSKVLGSAECKLITPLKIIEGRLTITDHRVRFFGIKFLDVTPVGENFKSSQSKGEWLSSVPESGDYSTLENSEECYGINGLPKAKIIVFTLREIRSFLPRRYLLCESAIEVFLKNNRSFLFNFEKKRRDEMFRILGHAARLPVELSIKKAIQYSGLTDRWRAREISNFEYLMHLNTLAGRSYNDLTQYPVFPWILSDYDSPEIDLNNPSIFRDLSKPIGALNPDRLPLFLEKFEDTKSGNLPPWHYGSHYSSPGIVLYYLIRCEPFTSLNVYHQGGKFDIPDRLFTSVPNAWRSCFTSTADVKELIPEFFYLPEMFKNMSNLHLGTKQDGSIIGDVELPPWAKSAEHFIEVNRAALESEFVSQNLHKWIDLIFGYKQKGPEAVSSTNVFFHLTYEGSVDLDRIQDVELRKATEAQITNFGQTPSQLFSKPHPPRDPLSVCRPILTFPTTFPFNYSPIILSSYDPSVKCEINFLRVVNTDVIIHVFSDSENGIRVVRYGFSQFLKTLAHLSSQHHDAVFNIPESFTTAGRKFSLIDSSLISRSCTSILRNHLGARSAVLSKNGRFVILGGFNNCSIKCFLSSNGIPISSVHGHCDVVTCISVANDNSIVATGAADGTVALWITNLRKFDANRLPPFASGETFIFAEHSSSVTDISHNAFLGIAVSISEDHTAVIYSLSRRRYIRTIQFASDFDLRKVFVNEIGRLIFYGFNKTEPELLLYTVNGTFLKREELAHPVTCLSATHKHGYILIGNSIGEVRIYQATGLDLVQVFDCCKTKHCQNSCNEISVRDEVTRDDPVIHRPISRSSSQILDVSDEAEVKKHPNFNVSKTNVGQDVDSEASCDKHNPSYKHNPSPEKDEDMPPSDVPMNSSFETMSELSDGSFEIEMYPPSPVLALDFSSDDSYFVAAMQDGRLLIFLMPLLNLPKDFRIVCQLIQSGIIGKRGKEVNPMNASLEQKVKTARDTLSNTFKSIGSNFSKLFGAK